MSTGVIYIATGRKFVNEACVSAESLKNKMPLPRVIDIPRPLRYVFDCPTIAFKFPILSPQNSV